MKRLSMSLVAAMSLFTLSQVEAAADAPKIRVVNFKTCVEQSKLGKQEQASFDALKKQMESVLGEKEKTLNEIATKFEDPDYLDSLSAEAETEMKRKFRTLNQEFSQLQNQYLQALQQTNFKVVQKLTDLVTKASAKVAQQEKIDLILNEEGSFFVDPALDISKSVIAIMDQMPDETPVAPKAEAPAPKAKETPAAPKATTPKAAPKAATESSAPAPKPKAVTKAAAPAAASTATTAKK